MESLKAKARAAGLWNLFLPESELGAGLTNLEYAPLCEIMGRSWIAPEAFNCNAPDTGNMEVLVRYGTPAQKKQWLEPLLAGEIRSAFAMTEPDVASSRRDQHRGVDRARRRPLRDQRPQVVDHRRPGPALQDPDLHGQDRRRQPGPPPAAVDDPRARRHARRATRPRRCRCSATTTRRTATASSTSTTCACPSTNMLLGEGRGFEIAQGRLGPGRIHHCMRLIGQAERSLELHVPSRGQRASPSDAPSPTRRSRRSASPTRASLIDQARLLVLHAAWKMDVAGNKAAKKEIAMIKVAAPNMACQVIDWAMQVHGARRRLRRLSARVLLRAGAHAALRRRSRRSAPQPDREDRAGGTSPAKMTRAPADPRVSPAPRPASRQARHPAR